MGHETQYAPPAKHVGSSGNVAKQLAAPLVAADIPKKLRGIASGRTAMTWSNQVAVVTGGARGIGRAIAHLSKPT
jgi:hypothetical protein